MRIFSKIKEWFVKKILKNQINKFLKKILDKLPANGGKTITSIVIAFIVSFLAAINGSGDAGILTEMLTIFLDSLRALPHGELNEWQATIVASLTTGAVGLYHKIVKLIFKDDE